MPVSGQNKQNAPRPAAARRPASAAKPAPRGAAVKTSAAPVPSRQQKGGGKGFLPIVLLALAAIVFGIIVIHSRVDNKQAEPVRSDVAVETQTPAAEPTETPLSQPTATPTPVPAYKALAAQPAAGLLPTASQWKYQSGTYVNGVRTYDYAAAVPMYFDDGANYTKLSGVTTFRGSNFRQNGAYGTAQLSRNEFKNLWRRTIGSIDSGYTTWSGVGWTGQPVLIKWPDELRRKMNINDEFINDSELVEVIYGTLDGNIYFWDAQTGRPTRSPIMLGFPIKGSVSIDPRGYPLLYVGQGISQANGVKGSLGFHIYSLLDQRELYFLDGRDSLSFRDHGSFDGSCVINAEADALLLGGENGIFYNVKLNSYYDSARPFVSVHPEVTAYRYKSSASSELGIENSIAAYGQYVWFADNGGLLTCMDVNSMQAVWLFNMGDDVDSSIALEVEADGTVALYAVNQVDKQGAQGLCTIYKLNAMTGEVLWNYAVFCTSDGTNGGGGFASPALGKHTLGAYVYFNVCYTQESGTLYCFNKRTGAVVWSKSTTTPSWSSPLLVYREDGTGVLIVGNSGGRGVLSMYDPLTGKRLNSISLEGKIECSPAVYNDILVLGTRECRVYGLKLQ